jgi:hypothetical protein
MFLRFDCRAAVKSEQRRLSSSPTKIAITLGKMPKDHQAHFQATYKSAPTEFAALWD